MRKTDSKLLLRSSVDSLVSEAVILLAEKVT